MKKLIFYLFLSLFMMNCAGFRNIESCESVIQGWNIQKSRLGMEGNHLKVQSNYFFCNGFAVVMSDWKTLHYNLTFEKQ